MITLKALGYFGDVPELSMQIRSRLSTAVARVDATRLPKLAAHAPSLIDSGNP